LHLGTHFFTDPNNVEIKDLRVHHLKVWSQLLWRGRFHNLRKWNQGNWIFISIQILKI